MSLSPLTLEDCKAAALLHQTSFEAGWDEDSFRTFLKDPLVFGVKIKNNKTLAGFILARRVLDESEILTLAVAPLHKRQGMGSLLLQALITASKNEGVHKLFLEVAEDNIPAQAFYLKHGFDLMGKRENYYKRNNGPAVSAITMSKCVI